MSTQQAASFNAFKRAASDDSYAQPTVQMSAPSFDLDETEEDDALTHLNLIKTLQEQSTFTSYYDYMRQANEVSKAKGSTAQLIGEQQQDNHNQTTQEASDQFEANNKKQPLQASYKMRMSKGNHSQLRDSETEPKLVSSRQAGVKAFLDHDFTFSSAIMDDDDPSEERPVENMRNADKVKLEKRKVDELKKELQNLYAKACQQFKVLPSQYVMENVTERHLNLRGRNLGDEGTKAICVMLLSNDIVNQLDLTDCNIRDSGAVAIAHLFDQNTHITDLSLGRNSITIDGLRSICEALKPHNHLRSLDLSGLHLRDVDAVIVEELVEKNSSIKKLVLSHNEFSVDGGVAMARALLNNDHLEVLDLSWNHLRAVGAVALANALKRNSRLRVLDVSMNGFGEEGCVAFAAALPKNSYLQELNLAKNRIAEKSLHSLLLGLLKNDSIIELNLNSNPITPSAALSFIRSLLKAPSSCALRQVDLRDITVDQEFRDLAERLSEERSITIQCGPIIRKAFDKRYEVAPVLMQADPLKILFSFMKRENLRVTELFQTFTAADANASQSMMKDRISRNAFVSGLRLVRVPLTNHQVDELVRFLDDDSDGYVSITDLMKAGKEYARREQERERQRVARVQREKMLPPKTVKERQTEFLTEGYLGVQRQGRNNSKKA